MSYYDSSTGFGAYLANGGNDVWAYVEQYLGQAGLGGLTTWAQDLLVEYGQDLTTDQFNQRIRETQDYKTRFKAITMARDAGLPVPTEAEVLEVERSYTQLMSQAGLPSSFYDSPDDFANLISKGVSPQEMQTRILDGYVAVRNDPTIQAQMSSLYGVGVDDGDLVAFYLDPDKATSILEQRQAAATIASKAANAGAGQLSQSQAERLAGLGITSSQATQGFGTLAQQQGLFNPLASETGSISQDTGIQATFENNAAANEILTRREAERRKAFAATGSFQKNNQGETGIGSAN